MKRQVLTLIIWLCIGASPVFAGPGHGHGHDWDDVRYDNGHQKHMGAPAPLLGLGIPSALAVGGVLLGAKFLRRRR
jgi:hypothetical protein